MLSIHQFAAFSDITTAAAPKDSNKFSPPDKQLYKEGVRPGQVWMTIYGGKEQFLSFIGYHKKGFLMLNIEARDVSPIPPISLFRYPQKIKYDLLTNIKKNTARMLSCVIQSLVDKTGNAKPGRELDVTLSAMMVYPAYWHNPIHNKNYFLSICDKGHYYIKEWYTSLGNPCNKQCRESKDSHITTIALDTALNTVHYGKSAKKQYKFFHLEHKQLSRSFIPFSMIETYSETQRILAANKTEILRPKISSEGHEVRQHYKTSMWLTEAGVRSGHIYRIGFNTSSDTSIHKIRYARMHRRECGNFHVELSKEAIFNGNIDPTLIYELLSGQELGIFLDKKSFTSLDKEYPLTKCSCCNTNNELIILFDDSVISYQKKTVCPIKTKLPSMEKTISIGDIVLYHSKPVVFYKKLLLNSGLRRAMLVTEKGRILTVPHDKLKHIPVMPELVNQFFDEIMLLKKKFNLQKWHNIVTVGSRLRLRTNKYQDSKADLSGQLITVAEPPSKIGRDYGVKVFECEQIVNLRTEVLPVKTSLLTNNITISYKDEDYTVSAIKNGTVTLIDSENRGIFVPEAALHITLNRGIAKIKYIYTADNLLLK